MSSNDDSAHFLSATHILYSNHCDGYVLNDRAVVSRERTMAICNATKYKKQPLKSLPAAKIIDDEQVLHQTAIGQFLQVKDNRLACTSYADCVESTTGWEQSCGLHWLPEGEHRAMRR